MATNKSDDNSQTANSGADSTSSQRYDGAIGNAESKQNSPAIDSHDDPDQQRAMVSSLLDGTFDENVQLHAENLAEKLIERQAELDRRELHLNRISLDIEKQMRQSRLAEQIADESDSEEVVQEETNDTSSNEVASTVESVDKDENSQNKGENSRNENDPADSRSEELLYYRVDRYIKAQRAPHSKLSTRMRKYLAKRKSRTASVSASLDVGQTVEAIADAVTTAESVDQSIAQSADFATEPRVESIPPISASIVESLGFESTKEVVTDPVMFSINNLTQSASAIRQRGEEVDAMYEQLADVFSEMLRQQAAMRQLASQMANSASDRDATNIQSVHKEIDRLTIQLTLVGREHFLLPAESEEAA